MSRLLKNIVYFLLAAIIFTGLLLSSNYNYLLFHTLVELFSILIAFSIFIIAWNSKEYIEGGSYLLFLGIGYLFIGSFDLMHTLSFEGMNIFAPGKYYANQLWISARYTESLTFLIASVVVAKKIRINEVFLLIVYSAIFIILILSIFYWENFPACYIEGEGQTSFKVISELIIIAVLLINIVLLHYIKSEFDKNIYRLILWSFILTILSEGFFTIYISNYGLSNLLGHLFKIASFFLIYRSLIVTGIKKPFSLLFRELKENEAELRNLNATKDRLFSIVAHDLKSPFNSLIGFSELLMKNYELFTKEERRNLFTTIHQSSKKAHTLLENLLQWSRSQTGALLPKPINFNIQEIVEDNITLLSSNIQEKKIELLNHINKPKEIFADKDMINTVVRNLLNNAIKFTPSGAIIEIYTKHTDKYIDIVVKDHGIGIAPEKLEKLFQLDQFHTTEGTAKEKGSGLGLIICKEFVDKNNGSIKVKSEPGQGSSFIISLPIKKDEDEKTTYKPYSLNQKN